MHATDLRVRPAASTDVAAIRALCAGERLNPRGLDRWQRFVVAAIGDRLVGAVQMREHGDGALELGTLVVEASARGEGVASRLIDALLARHRPPVYMITADVYAGHYGRWGFRILEPSRAPRSVRRNWQLGRLGRVVSWLLRMPPKRLVILRRA